MQVNPPTSAGKSGGKANGKSRGRAGAAARKDTLHIHKDSSPEDTPIDWSNRIATAAYFLAEHRGFEPGHELEDWLSAERVIDADLRESMPRGLRDDQKT